MLASGRESPNSDDENNNNIADVESGAALPLTGNGNGNAADNAAPINNSPSFKRKIWAAFDLRTAMIGFGNAVFARSWLLEIPVIGKVVLYALRREAKPAFTMLEGAIAGGTTHYLQNKFNPGCEANVSTVTHVVDQVVASSAVSVVASYGLTAAAGAAFVAGPPGVLALAAVDVVVGPPAAKALDKLVERVGPSVRDGLFAAGRRIHDCYTYCRGYHRGASSELPMTAADVTTGAGAETDHLIAAARR
ncbi:MAG: hypothetical protein A3E83_03195 [Gammaproteobacteria bacterium RIFCSPHIGHO2_12_FULL_41_20]|nr:MAG: hypothetical protein A3E83_03195 [Gammaproteobacteria bacterium RIFCSPHIGHO2_12_FULL_41_20]